MEKLWITNFQLYAKQVKSKCTGSRKSNGEDNGFDIVSGGTDNHLMLIDLRNKNVNGKINRKSFSKADITCNKNMVPFDDNHHLLL